MLYIKGNKALSHNNLHKKMTSTYTFLVKYYNFFLNLVFFICTNCSSNLADHPVHFFFLFSS